MKLFQRIDSRKRRSPILRTGCGVVVAIALSGSMAADVLAQDDPPTNATEKPLDARAFKRQEALPDELDVGVDQKQGAQIPLDLRFKDSLGRQRTLKEFFGQGRPVILTLNYFRCPMLCSLQLNAMLDGGEAARNAGRKSGLQGLSFTPAIDFDILTVSFDPLEGPKLAHAKKSSYVREYGRPTAGKGWHFLTGGESAIKALTDAVGFRYKWNAAQKQYSHPSALIVCTPDGVVSQYLDGLVFESKKIEDALREASAGKIGSVLHDFLLFTCFQYDPASGSYAASAFKIMRTGGIFTVIAVVIFLLTLRRRRTPVVGAGTSRP